MIVRTRSRCCRSLRVASGALLVVLLGACSPIRGQLALHVAPIANPASGPAVRFARVTDARVFQAKVTPAQMSTPSLRGDEIDNADLKSRAIARKVDGKGDPSGDVILPAGRTVAQLVEEALTRGFREAGYRVLGPADTGHEGATPLVAEVQQLWAWQELKPHNSALLFQAAVRMTGEVAPLQGGATVRVSTQEERTTADTRAWRAALNKGLDELVRNTRMLLEKR